MLLAGAALKHQELSRDLSFKQSFDTQDLIYSSQQP